MQRDHENSEKLQGMGWTVLRFWESDILGQPDAVIQQILRILDERDHRRA